MNPYFLMLGLVLIVAGAVSILLVRLDRDRRTAPYPHWPKYLVWSLVRLYCRIYHRPKIVGLAESLEKISPNEPVILIANHTGAVDPLIIGTNFRRGISWMMEKSYNKGPAKIVTWTGGTIYLNRDGKDTEGIRQALRELKDGGVVGIFPEGGIARPPEKIRPFQSGVGFLIRKSGAVVLPVWISGTPKVNHTLDSLFIPSRSRCVFGEPIRFSNDLKAQAIADRLREMLREMSGWSLIEDVECCGEVRDEAAPVSM